MRSDVKPEKVVLAVAKAAEACFTRGDWLEFGYETGFADEVRNHPRLLRSLDWSDDDYSGHVLDMMEGILRPPGRKTRRGPYAITDTGISADNFAVAEKMLDLPKWLAKNEPRLHSEIYDGQELDAGVDELQAAASSLGLQDVDVHAARIRKGLRDDPAQAIGSSKELLETVLKAVLGLHGNGPETKKDVVQLTKEVGVRLGLDPGGVRGSESGAEQRRRMLGSLAQLVFNTAELRNAGYGTGHGLSRGPSLDIATARLAVSAAVAAATFYIEAYAAHQRSRP
ncbi:abortive infection family protein [Streptomyces sp. G-G2]|uniref:abortive infection family protein n=1 Tax=Streptomyces sp. G-G2 TaxID=3046201 RepID=UPI0024BB8E55|nr:abortive infection family protein [Streptomyces sp. G-G2]MDJ0383228.1 abortive infection family protein [Streptomyces sp. G-G2]